MKKKEKKKRTRKTIWSMVRIPTNEVRVSILQVGILSRGEKKNLT